MRKIESGMLERLPETVDAAARRLYELHPELLLRYDAEGQKRCREDLAYHVEYLAVAVGFGDAEPFIQYLRWLNEVLFARAVPLDCLKSALRILRETYAQMPEPWAEVAVRQLDLGLSDLDRPVGSAVVVATGRGELSTAGALLEAMLAGDRRSAQAVVVAELAAGCRLAEVGDRLIQPTMYEIGALWQKNHISVAQEHLATAIIQYVLAQAYTQLDAQAQRPQRAMFANIETNHHALGLRIVADVFDLAGWSTQYLGANVPSAALIAQVDAWRPDLLGLSVSMPQQFAQARAAIGGLRAELGSRCPTVVLGGLAVNRYAPRPDRLGADLFVRDAMDADAMARAP